MSRAERRAYKRMTRNQDPLAPPPAARAARERQARQRQRRATTTAREPQRLFTGRALAWTLGGAGVTGLIAFSIAWPNGLGTALVAGIGIGLLWAAAVTGILLLRRRSARERAVRPPGR
jgi:hypothetical protein